MLDTVISEDLQQKKLATCTSGDSGTQIRKSPTCIEFMHSLENLTHW